ncbi:hypothetical protein DIE23_25585 [Burkholderia sp. Bp9143]|nr:hypothetical protein DIE23_25585 [Burkholderia sp. Bp9143]
MLTFCRQCRATKGARKPGVGPVACYRGMATAVTSIAHLTGRAQGRPRGLAMVLCALADGAVPVPVAVGQRFLAMPANLTDPTDGYAIYTLPGLKMGCPNRFATRRGRRGVPVQCSETPDGGRWPPDNNTRHDQETRPRWSQRTAFHR